VLTPKAYLAKFIDSNCVEDLFENMSDEAALIILGDLVSAKKRKVKEI
jgi:hypothetical protein